MPLIWMSLIYYKDISCTGVLSVDLTLFLQELIGVKWRGGSWLFRPETIDGKISRRKVTFRFLLLTQIIVYFMVGW